MRFARPCKMKLRQLLRVPRLFEIPSHLALQRRAPMPCPQPQLTYRLAKSFAREQQVQPKFVHAHELAPNQMAEHSQGLKPVRQTAVAALSGLHPVLALFHEGVLRR